MTNLNILATVELPLLSGKTITFNVIECSQGVVLKKQNYKREFSLLNLEYNLVVKHGYLYYRYIDTNLFNELGCPVSDDLEIVKFESKEKALQAFNNWSVRFLVA